MPSPNEPFDPQQPTQDFVPAVTPQPETVSFLRTDESTGVRKPAFSPPPTDAPSIPGYRITAEIAQGGMGRVYSAFDETLDREVAIKTLLPGADAERFVTEAKITAKLPHPAIPPVHALGTLPDGTPWLAMKLIHGQTLASLLQSRDRDPSRDREGAESPAASLQARLGSDDLPRYIQIFEQIAQAVGFAHSRGVIHRDLKPLNVMVGEFGEVQVMDWGLAKDITSRDREGADNAAVADASGSLDHTAAGTILGTPGYMAPEQARGEVVDQRADVFALGSILATILTGHPAFIGNSKWEILDKSARADLSDVLTRLDACGADAELVGLCKRCLSARREDRPENGQAVAAEVAAYRASVEQRLRQAETDRAKAETQAAEQTKRRRLTLMAAGVVAAVLLAGLGVSWWQMDRAIDAEHQARLNERKAEEERDAKDRALTAERQARQQAMTALRFMTDDLVERQLARGPYLSDQDKAFLRQAIQHFEGFAAITADDAESRLIRAEGHGRVAQMRFHLGELEEAERSSRAALAICKQLVADFPTVAEYRQALALSHHSLGNIVSRIGPPQEAEAEYRASLELRKQLVADFPTIPQYRQDLATSYDNLGSLLFATGRPQEAEDLIRVGLASMKRLVADFPAVSEYRQGLAASHNNLGSFLYATGRPQEAETEFRSALELQKQLVKDLDTKPEFCQVLATYHHNLGLLLFDTGRHQEAVAEYRAALLLRKRLAEDFPTVPSYRRELAANHNNIGIVLNATGRPQEAETEYRVALALRKQLVAQFPMVPDYAQDLAVTLLNLAIIRNQARRFAEARELLEEARPHHQAALETNPNNPYYRRSFRHNLVNMCLAFLGLGEHGTAADEAEELARFGFQPPTDTYDAACYVARCIRLAEADSQLTEAERKLFAQEYAERAMKLLRQAVKLGFNDIAHIKSDPDLEPLRSREDFQKLVAEPKGNR